MVDLREYATGLGKKEGRKGRRYVRTYGRLHTEIFVCGCISIMAHHSTM
jgi:hypothetical protein